MRRPSLTRLSLARSRPRPRWRDTGRGADEQPAPGGTIDAAGAAELDGRVGSDPGRAMRLLAILALALAVCRYGDVLINAQDASDWHAYYRAAANLQAGADIYREGTRMLARNSYEYWLSTDGQYVYPPLLAFLVTPYTLLDLRAADYAWLLTLTLAVAAVVWVMLRVLGRPPRLETLVPVAVPVLGGVPLLLGVRHGQVDIILLLLTTLALLAYLRRHDVLAGVALGAALAVKPVLAWYGLFYLRKRRWTTLVAAGATGLLLGLGPFAVLAPGALADWLAIARYYAGDDLPTYPSNQSARGFLLRLFAGGPRHAPLLTSRPLADVLWVVVVLGALALWWRCVSSRPDRGGRSVVEYALTATLMLLAAPLSEDIHYVALLLALVVLADRATWGTASARWTALAVVAVLYFMQPWLDFAYNYFLGQNRGGPDLRRQLTSGAYLYGLLLVGAALVAVLWPRRAGWWERRGAPVTDDMRASGDSVAEPVGAADRREAPGQH